MPTLYLIPTPIADDALHTLPEYVLQKVRKLDVFIVERAKTARHFVKSTGPEKAIADMQFTELPDHQQQDKTAELAFLAAIEAGKDVGLLSEAGCPGVADPGATIVALAHRKGVKVMPLIGPSSILLALMASGMNGQQFAFLGYLSPKRPELASDLRKLEQQARTRKQTQIFIETPYRSQMVLEVALEALQPDTVFCVAQDISGAAQMILSLPVKEWKKKGAMSLVKAPAVFLIGG